MSQVLWSAAPSCRGGIALISPAESNPQLMLTVGEPWVGPVQADSTVVIKLQLSRLLKFIGAALLSISCQEETSLWDRLKQEDQSLSSTCWVFFYFLSLHRKFSTGLVPYITPGARLLAKMAVICFRDTVITLMTVQFLTAKWKQMGNGLKDPGIPTSGGTWCDIAGAEDAAQLGSSSKLWSLGTQTCSYLWIAGIKLPLGHIFKAKEGEIWHRF